VVDPGVLRTAHYVPAAGAYRTAEGAIVVPWDKEWIKSATKATREHILTEEQLDELLTHASARRGLDDGIRVEFDTTVPTDDLMRVVVAEQDCCQFFRFAITVDTRGIALEVTAPADARLFVESLFVAPA
jgi:hypothetical protein